MSYEVLKYIHLISLVFLFGWGVASALFMFFAYLTKNAQICSVSTRLVVFSDTLFTTPAFFVQPISGYFLMEHLGYSFDTYWFYAVAAAYAIMGVAWFPVVWLQIRLRDISAALEPTAELPEIYHNYMKWWCILAVPGGASVVFLVFIMVLKPWMVTA